MAPNQSPRPRARFRGSAPLLLAALIVVAGAVLVLGGPSAGQPGASPSPTPIAQASETPGPPTPTPSPASTPTPSPPPLPAGLDNRTWVTLNEVEGIGYVAGTLDGRHQLVLPAGEFPLDARDGRVMSVRYGPVAASGVPTTSTVIVRDVTSGGVLVEVDPSGAIASGVLGADTAYVAAGASEIAGLVPAIQAISLADGTVREVLPAQDVGVDPDGSPPWNAASGGRLKLSPSGRTLGFCIFQNRLCDIQVIDLEAGSSWIPVRGHDGGLALLSDEVLVAVGNHLGITGYDIATGKTAWFIENAMAESGYLLRDWLTLVLAFSDYAVDGHVVATIDLRTGATRELLRTPQGQVAPYLWVAASNDRYAVLVYGGSLPAEALVAAGSLTADLLDLSTGSIERFTLRVSIRGRQ